MAWWGSVRSGVEWTGECCEAHAKRIPPLRTPQPLTCEHVLRVFKKSLRPSFQIYLTMIFSPLWKIVLCGTYSAGHRCAGSSTTWDSGNAWCPFHRKVKCVLHPPDFSPPSPEPPEGLPAFLRAALPHSVPSPSPGPVRPPARAFPPAQAGQGSFFFLFRIKDLLTFILAVKARRIPHCRLAWPAVAAHL